MKNACPSGQMDEGNGLFLLSKAGVQNNDFWMRNQAGKPSGVQTQQEA